MRGYQRSWLRFDVLAGLAAGTVVIPQAMAYATIAGLPVQVGLYTCMLPMLVYAVLGGSRSVSVSTTSTIAVLVASTLASTGSRDPQHLLSAAFTLTVLVGVCLLVMRLFRLGSLVENISPATLTGIKFGVGLTVAAGQLPALLGVPADPEATGFFAKIGDAVSKIPQTNLPTIAVAVGSIILILVLRRVLPAVPGPLVVVVAGIMLVAATDLEQRGLELVDRVPSGLPSPVLPVPAEVLALLPGALAVSIMSFLETVLVARTNRRRDEPRIDSDQELLATGLAAVAGGFTQTLPPAGGFSQSAVNLRAGARTQISGVVTAALAVLVALFLAPLLADLPLAVLSAMVMVAVVGLLDPTDLFRYARIDRAELWVALVVAVLGLTGGMLLGVAVGIALTLLLVVRQVNRARVRPLYPRRGGGWTTNPPDPDAESTVPPEVVLLHLDGGLYTGNAQATQDAVLETVRASEPPARTVVLEGSAVHGVTVPMIDTLRALDEELAAEGTELVLAGFPTAVLDSMRRSQWFAEAETRGLVAATVDTALAATSPATSDSSTPRG
ncbi:MAG: SulP family inorganic anion transporter [Propionibacteriaceae bacterium]